MVVIKEAEANDLPVISELVNSAYRGETSRKGWTTEADLLDGIRIDITTLEFYIEGEKSTILKCVNDENTIVGCVYLMAEGNALYLGMLTVAPELQNKGIGKKLLVASEQYAKTAGLQKISITVITKRVELIGWYERNGFIKTGERQPFPKEERFGIPKEPLEFFVMEKNL